MCWTTHDKSTLDHYLKMHEPALEICMAVLFGGSLLQACFRVWDAMDDNKGLLRNVRLYA